MKKLLISLILCLILISPSQAVCGCSNAEYEAYDGYRDAKKAYRAKNLKDCQRYAKKAYRHASYTEDYAGSCDY